MRKKRDKWLLPRSPPPFRITVSYKEIRLQIITTYLAARPAGVFVFARASADSRVPENCEGNTPGAIVFTRTGIFFSVKSWAKVRPSRAAAVFKERYANWSTMSLYWGKSKKSNLQRLVISQSA